MDSNFNLDPDRAPWGTIAAVIFALIVLFLAFAAHQ